MPRANAEAKKAEMKAATRNLARRGVTKPKHEPAPTEEGIDTPAPAVVQSGFSVFNQPQEERPVTDPKTPAPKLTDEQKAAKAAEKAAAQAAREEATKAKIAAKEEKQRLAAEKKAAAEAAKAEKAAAREAAKAAKAEALAAAGEGYHGSMLALRDAKARYVKASNGRLRSTDDIATVFDCVEPTDVVAIAMTALKLESNPYQHLNIGQQSMNLRNRLRGAVKKGVLTVADITAVRDDGGYTAKVEQRLAEASAKKQAREAKKAANESHAAAAA